MRTPVPIVKRGFAEVQLSGNICLLLDKLSLTLCLPYHSLSSCLGFTPPLSSIPVARYVSILRPGTPNTTMDAVHLHLR